jgi:hypothetical protein
MKRLDSRYLLQWKGKQLGPYTLDDIRLKLNDGEISLMHQVNLEGRWTTLDELLSLDTAKETELKRQQEERIAGQKAELQQRHELELAEERAKRNELTEKLNALESQLNSQRHAPPPPTYPPITQRQLPPEQKVTSGMAIAALVMGILNFVPFVNFVSWLFAIIFGHLALSQIKEDPSIEGRGMAVAGLVITYTLLAIGICLLIGASIGYARLPRF